jgi:hypothetical protein
MGNLNFDASNYDPTKADFAPLPVGDYVFMINDTEQKITKNGDNAYLQIALKIPEGQPYAGRVIFDRFNLWAVQGDKYVFRSDQAGQIASENFSSLCHAIGVISPQNHEELRGKKVLAKVVIKEDKTGQYSPSNEVKKYAPAASAVVKPVAFAKVESTTSNDAAPF